MTFNSDIYVCKRLERANYPRKALIDVEKDYSGDIVHWIELGLPDEKRVRIASSKSEKVTIYTYHYNRALDWFEKNSAHLIKNKKVEVFHFKVCENGPIEKLVAKTMNLSCTIEDTRIYLGNDEERVGIDVIKAC